MTVRRISISEFKAHCTEEIRAVEQGGVILQVTRHGKIVATVEPNRTPDPAPLSSWLGSGRGTVTVLRDEVLTAPTLAWHEDAQDVWTPRTAEQYAEQQGIRPINDPQSMLGNGAEEDWTGFDEWLEASRNEQMIQPLADDMP